MPRKLSKISPDWWDYTTLEDSIIRDAAALSEKDLEQLSRPGFKVVMYDTLEDFYLAEALEYIDAWRDATADNPSGICGPIGPTEQLPLVVRLVNELGIDVSNAHFWGMDEWIGEDGKEVSIDHPLSFERADRHLCSTALKARSPIPNCIFQRPTSLSLLPVGMAFDAGSCRVARAISSTGPSTIRCDAKASMRMSHRARRSIANSGRESLNCTLSLWLKTHVPPVAATYQWCPVKR